MDAESAWALQGSIKAGFRDSFRLCDLIQAMKWNKVTVFPFVWLFFSLYDMDQKTKLLESSKLGTPAHDRITREVQKLCFTIHHKRLHCMRADVYQCV